MEKMFLESIISSYFGNEKCIGIEKLSGGLTNFNYKIYMPKRREYFLKVFRNALPERVAAIAGLIKNIVDFHFPTPALILCENDALFWESKSQSAIMTDFIKGHYPEKNLLNLYKIGTILGTLHQIPAKEKLIQGYSLNYSEQLNLMREACIVLPDDLNQLLKHTDPILQNIPDGGFPQSIIHGDVFLDNLLLTDFEDIYFIDFEGGCIDKSIFDLARAVIGCTIEKGHINLNLTGALINGYNIARKLETKECSFLYDYILYAGTVSTIWRFIEFNIKRPNENKSQLYQELLQPTLNLLNLSKNKFNDHLYIKTDL